MLRAKRFEAKAAEAAEKKVNTQHCLNGLAVPTQQIKIYITIIKT